MIPASVNYVFTAYLKPVCKVHKEMIQVEIAENGLVWRYMN